MRLAPVSSKWENCDIGVRAADSVSDGNSTIVLPPGADNSVERATATLFRKGWGSCMRECRQAVGYDLRPSHAAWQSNRRALDLLALRLLGVARPRAVQRACALHGDRALRVLGSGNSMAGRGRDLDWRCSRCDCTSTSRIKHRLACVLERCRFWPRSGLGLPAR